MKNIELICPVDLPIEDIFPHQDRFAHRSTWHGPEHVARVMVHAFLLLELTGSQDLALPLWASVFTHDLARTHDGVCHTHGKDAAGLLQKDDDLRAHLGRGGARHADLAGITAAVSLHSGLREADPDHPHVRLVRLLKDADGLDRVRLGDLDPSYLRHDITRRLVPFAQQLLEETWPQDPVGFWAEAGKLWSRFRVKG